KRATRVAQSSLVSSLSLRRPRWAASEVRVGHVELRVAGEAKPAHPGRDARRRARVARRDDHRDAYRATVLDRRADADFGAVRHITVRKVATSVQDSRVLTASDVCLATRATDAHLLYVRGLCGLAALAAAQDRKAAAASDDAAASASALFLGRVQARVELHVGLRLHLNGDLVVAVGAGFQEPEPCDDQQRTDAQHADQRLASRAARLLNDHSLDRRFFSRNIAGEPRVFGEGREFFPVFDGAFVLAQRVANDVAIQEGVGRNLLQQLDRAEWAVI